MTRSWRKHASVVGVDGNGAVTVAGVPLDRLTAIDQPDDGPRSKRSAILTAAVDHFGRSGYDDTKWSAISGEVGIGQTALYHYFESKAHCLLTILRLELAQSYLRFLESTGDRADLAEAARAAVTASFNVNESEMSRMRILVFNVDILANPRASEREETERRLCLGLTHAIEDGWSELIAELLKEKADDRDPVLAAQSILGILNSVWHWFRPGGSLSHTQVRDFYVDAAMRILV